MNRIHHVLTHLNQKNTRIDKHRNDASATSKGHRISENYCDIKIADCCARLCQWIYNVSNPEVEQSLPIHPFCNQYDDKGWNIIKTEPGNTAQNITSYSILSPKILKDTLFIVFAGTQPTEKPLHVIVNLCAVHQPLRHRSNPSIPIARVHTGIYGDMKRDFEIIHQQYLSGENLQNIKHVIITGHSLGGGLAILFAYNTLRFKRHFDNIKLDVVTFGSPMVFADIRDHHIIEQLSQMCHNFINLHDPVPRLPGAKEWVQNVLPAMVKKIGQDMMGKLKYVPFVGSKLKDVPDILMNKINNPKTLEMFSEYFPCGKYYFIGGDKMAVSSNIDITKKRLFYNPFDLNDSSTDFMKVAENHFCSSYIETLQRMKSSNGHVVSLRKLSKMQDDVKKKRLIHVLKEISQSSSDNLLNEIKNILDENQKSSDEKYKNIKDVITKALAQQNESQLLKYKEILKKLMDQNKIMNQENQAQMKMSNNIMQDLKKQNESASKNYNKIINQLTTQKKSLEDQKKDELLLNRIKTQNGLLRKQIMQQKENKGVGWKQMLLVNFIAAMVAGGVIRSYVK